MPAIGSQSTRTRNKPSRGLSRSGCRECRPGICRFMVSPPRLGIRIEFADEPVSIFFAECRESVTKDSTKSRLASLRVCVPQKSAAYAFTSAGSRLCWRISRQSWSRSRGWPLLEPFDP